MPYCLESVSDGWKPPMSCADCERKGQRSLRLVSFGKALLEVLRGRFLHLRLR